MKPPMPAGKRDRSNTVDTKVDVRQYFESRLRRFGDSPKSLDWSVEGQRRRFEVLCGIGDISGREILDVGCGLGHLHDFLRVLYRNFTYAGLDVSPRMIEAARQRIPSVSFLVFDATLQELPRRADFVFASGVLNVETGKNELAMRRLLESAFTACRIGVAVNMLSKWWNGPPDPARHYFDPTWAVRLAGRLTNSVVLRHDYLPHDLTLYLYR